MSILKRRVNSSSDFSSFFSVIRYNSCVNFQLTHFLLWTKGSHESTNLDTYKCSDENLANSSCYFPNHKSVFSNFVWLFSVIKSNSSVLFQIKRFYFVQKGPIKARIFQTSQCSDQNSPNSCHFLNKKMFSSNFAALFSIMRHNSSVLWQLTFYIISTKFTLSKYKIGEISRDQSKV